MEVESCEEELAQIETMNAWQAIVLAETYPAEKAIVLKEHMEAQDAIVLDETLAVQEAIVLKEAKEIDDQWEGENWKTITGFRRYEVSNFGRVRNKRTIRILKRWNPELSYPYVNLLSDSGKPTICLVYKLVAKEFIMNPQNLRFIRHIDGNRHNVRWDNLEWCTKSDCKREQPKRTTHLRVQKISRATGELLETFETIKHASRSINASEDMVTSLCRQGPNSRHEYIWQYEPEQQLQGEIWKLCKMNSDVKFTVSNCGRIRSSFTNRLLQQTKKHGYMTVKFGRKQLFFVHRLIATAFLENPNNYNLIDHINGDRADNRVENLRWVTSRQNNEFATARAVEQLDLKTDKIIRKFVSVGEAARTIGCSSSNIFTALKGVKRKSAGGYKWRYYVAPECSETITE